MGHADTITKQYMKNQDIFADAFNFFIYNGEQQILAEQLRSLDNTYAELLPDNSSIQRVRDGLEYLTAMTDQQTAYAVLGIENQTEIHYAMPVRNMLYDALEYTSQVRQTASAHKEKHHYKVSRGEYLSGFHKTDKLTPVLTLVIYFGSNPWDGPRSLHDMMNLKDDSLRNLIVDYPLYLIAPAQINDADFSKFHTSLGPVLKFIKYSKEKDKIKQLLAEDTYKHMDYMAAKVLSSCTHMNVNLEENKEEIDMCQAIDELVEDGRAEGFAESQLIIALKLLKEPAFTSDKVAELTGLSIQEVENLKLTIA
ncbi:MAG: Rpn family recombination-promoting nuclease/putative transposase [Peptococcaceae bacterium]|nr:Rpn family recombination-promoting nuclease/putative transposase [Peptococcaceae bacterium]